MHANKPRVTEFRCVKCGCRWLMHAPFLGVSTVTFSLKNAEHKPCAECDGPGFERVIVPVEVMAPTPNAASSAQPSSEGER